jgi:integrase/recombinase XerD
VAQASVLTDAEVRRIFKIIDSTRYAKRNRMVFTLSIFAGLRVGEIAALTIGDVYTQDGSVRREAKLGAHQTKGNKGRTVVLSDRVQKELTIYQKFLGKSGPSNPLIQSQRGRSFSNVTLSTLMKEIYSEAGINTSSHSGRRTFATNLNSIGVGMATIQKLMGHASISTTAIYCSVSDETLKNAVDQL